MRFEGGITKLSEVSSSSSLKSVPFGLIFMVSNGTLEVLPANRFRMFVDSGSRVSDL